MTLVESLAFSMAPANKAVVIKTMMRRFQISDPVVAEEGYQDYLTSVDANLSRARMACATSED